MFTGVEWWFPLLPDAAMIKNWFKMLDCREGVVKVVEQRFPFFVVFRFAESFGVIS